MPESAGISCHSRVGWNPEDRSNYTLIALIYQTP